MRDDSAISVALFCAGFALAAGATTFFTKLNETGFRWWYILIWLGAAVIGACIGAQIEKRKLKKAESSLPPKKNKPIIDWGTDKGGNEKER